MATELIIEEGWVITNGPSREELFDALRLFDERRRVAFDLMPPRGRASQEVRMRALIKEIGVDDGSGHSWQLKVHFVVDPGGSISLGTHHAVDVYYNDRARNGVVFDARPASERPRIDREGNICVGGQRIARIEGTEVVAI